METCSRAPSCDHFGCSGKWKLYLATKILKKVANWWPTDQLKKWDLKKILGVKVRGGEGGFMGRVKIFFFNCESHWKATFWKNELGALCGVRRFCPLSSLPLPHTMFAPTLFEFDPIKSSLPLDWVISRWVDS